MAKIGPTASAARRCKCGRTKPTNRQTCYTCRPKRGTYIPLPETDEPYSLADWVAISRACGMSYGKLMGHVFLGGVPPIRRKVEWPVGSAHVGE